MVTLKQVSEAIGGLRERRGATMKQIHKLLKAEYGDRGAPSSYDLKMALKRGFQSGHLERRSTDQTPRFLLQTSSARPAKPRTRPHAFAAKSTSEGRGKRKIFHCSYCCCCKIMNRMVRNSRKKNVVQKDKGGKIKGKAKSKKGRKTTRKRKGKTKQSSKGRNSPKTSRKSKTKNSSSSDVSRQKKSRSATTKRSKTKRDESDKKSDDKGESQSPMPMALFP